MVKGMSVVVNVMLSLMSEMSPPPVLFFKVDIRHWPMQIYYMTVINISTINNYLQSG